MTQSRKFLDSFRLTKRSWHALRRFSSKKDCCSSDGESISLDSIKSAYDKIRSNIIFTPCPPSKLGKLYNMNIFMKCEFMQFTGSFKERGALNALLKLDDGAKKKGVISASLGNHAKALSYHAQRLKIPVTLVMPSSVAMMIVTQCQNFGANVIIKGDSVDESRVRAQELAKEKSLKYIHRSDNPDIIMGHGTVALEIMKQVPKVDAIIVPVGAGALIAGVAVAIKGLKPDCLVYGIESETCPSLCMALKKGTPVKIKEKATVADNLSVGTVSSHALTALKPLLDKHIVASEECIVQAILLMVERQKYVVEGSGACAIAALMSNLVPELKNKNVVPILTGGNMDTTVLGRCLQRGLAASGRLVKFKVTVTDRPGGGAELCRMIAGIGVSIKDLIQERAWVKGDIFSVRIKIIAETRDKEHVKELQELIAGKYHDWEFGDKQQISEEPEKRK